MNTDTAKSEQVELSFLLKWEIVSTIGWIVVSATGWSVSPRGAYDDQEYIAWILTWLVSGIIGGLIGGISQWLVLKGRLHQLSSWVVVPIWIWSAIISYALGSFAVTWFFPRSSIGLLLTLIGLALTGIPQWFILRRYVTNAGRWLIVVPIGLVVSIVPTFFYFVFIYMYDVGFYWYADVSLVIKRGAIPGTIGGVIFGLITAVALSVILRSTSSQSVSSVQENN